MSNNFYDACANVFNHPEYQAELLEAKALRGELSKLKDEYIEQVKKEAGYLTRIGDLEKLVQEQTRMAENLKREGPPSSSSYVPHGDTFSISANSIISSAFPSSSSKPKTVDHPDKFADPVVRQRYEAQLAGWSRPIYSTEEIARIENFSTPADSGFQAEFTGDLGAPMGNASWDALRNDHATGVRDLLNLARSWEQQRSEDKKLLHHYLEFLHPALTRCEGDRSKPGAFWKVERFSKSRFAEVKRKGVGTVKQEVKEEEGFGRGASGGSGDGRRDSGTGAGQTVAEGGYFKGKGRAKEAEVARASSPSDDEGYLNMNNRSPIPVAPHRNPPIPTASKNAARPSAKPLPTVIDSIAGHHSLPDQLVVGPFNLEGAGGDDDEDKDEDEDLYGPRQKAGLGVAAQPVPSNSSSDVAAPPRGANNTKKADRTAAKQALKAKSKEEEDAGGNKSKKRKSKAGGSGVKPKKTKMDLDQESLKMLEPYRQTSLEDLGAPAMKKTELTLLLSKANEHVSGTKAELAARLFAFLQTLPQPDGAPVATEEDISTSTA